MWWYIRKKSKRRPRLVTYQRLAPMIFRSSLMRLIFDIETDGLLESVGKIHSLCAYDLKGKKFYSCCNMIGYDHDLDYGIKLLHDSDQLIGHNIHGFDLPVIEKVNGKHFAHWHVGEGLTRGVLDTQVLARLCFPDIKDKDLSGHFGNFDRKFIGKHSLAAWGSRLGVPKGDFGANADWKVWTKAMQKYCEQDVRVTYKLYAWVMGYIKNNIEDFTCVELEHKFAQYISTQNHNGCPFNVEKAEKLKAKVNGTLEQLKKELDEVVPDEIEEIEFTPKTSNKKYGYVKGRKIIKKKVKKIKPSSRPQIIAHLKRKYDYVPEEVTDKGNPSLNTDTLRSIDQPECRLYADYLDLWKLRGQLWSGKNSWLKLQRDGTLYGFCNHNGAVTGRCTHSYPNLSQVPTNRKILGQECRSLFYAPEGSSFVGADAKGLELRMLGHYLHPFDQGEFIHEVVNGDIHSKNQVDAGLSDRDSAKRFIYAFNYGAGLETLGAIANPTASSEEKRTIGGGLKRRFLELNPAVRELIARVQGAGKIRKYIYGLDGRKLHIRHSYRALNSLLQGAGAAVMKQATVEFAEYVDQHLDWDIVRPALHSHDEMQVIVTNGYEDQVGEALVKSIVKAGTILGVRTPLDGTYKIGMDWSQTH